MKEAISVPTAKSIVDLSAAVWRKSSRSGNGTNDNCVEVAAVDAVSWFKSSRSGNGSGGSCVEVAFAGSAIAVRDSKSPDTGTLVLPAASWFGLLARLA